MAVSTSGSVNVALKHESKRGTTSAPAIAASTREVCSFADVLFNTNVSNLWFEVVKIFLRLSKLLNKLKHLNHSTLQYVSEVSKNIFVLIAWYITYVSTLVRPI